MKKNIKVKAAVLLVLVLIFNLFITGCGKEKEPAPGPDLTASATDEPLPIVTPPGTLPNASYLFSVYVIDVGQGHSVLVESNKEYMLIDSGEREYASTVKDFLKKHNVDKLKYAVASHPHSDHMGAMADIINSVSIETFIMPDAQNNTDAFERMLQALNDKKTQVSIPNVGDKLTLGNAEITILAPSKGQHLNLNDTSIGMRIAAKNSSFIITGDATTTSEKEMIDSKLTLDSDVMLVPHHGSESSSSRRFIEAVSPSVGIICVGADNPYGHPDPDVVQRYTDAGIPLYRTDVYGTICIGFTSGTYYISTDKDGTEPTTANSNKPDTEYIGNKKSHKYHLPTCENLPSEKNQVIFHSIEEAEENGYEPCGNCMK